MKNFKDFKDFKDFKELKGTAKRYRKNVIDQGFFKDFKVLIPSTVAQRAFKI